MVTQLLPSDPFFRTSIGFDRLFNTLDRLNSASHAQETYPPYNIFTNGDDSFVIELALAGFKKEEIEVEVKEATLQIVGQKEEDTGKNYIHKGIGGRRFQKAFTLAEYVEVDTVNFVDGILTIFLERRVPEEKKPRKLVINSKPELLVEAAQ